MSLQDFILESINQSTLQVFSTMLGVELAPGEFVAPGSRIRNSLRSGRADRCCGRMGRRG